MRKMPVVSDRNIIRPSEELIAVKPDKGDHSTALEDIKIIEQMLQR